jgi:hypothetical protein
MAVIITKAKYFYHLFICLSLCKIRCFSFEKCKFDSLIVVIVIDNNYYRYCECIRLKGLAYEW